MKNSFKKSLLLLTILPLVGCTTAEKKQAACSATDAKSVYTSIYNKLSAEDYTIETPKQFSSAIKAYVYYDYGDGGAETTMNVYYQYDSKTNTFLTTMEQITSEGTTTMTNVIKKAGDDQFYYSMVEEETTYIFTAEQLFDGEYSSFEEAVNDTYKESVSVYEQGLDPDDFAFSADGGLSEEDKADGSTFESSYGSDNDASVEIYEKFANNSTIEYPGEEEGDDPIVVTNDSYEIIKVTVKDYKATYMLSEQNYDMGDIKMIMKTEITNYEKLTIKVPDVSGYRVREYSGE